MFWREFHCYTKSFDVDVAPISREFYAAFNSVLSRRKQSAESVKLQLNLSAYRYRHTMLVLWSLAIWHRLAWRCVGMMNLVRSVIIIDLSQLRP